MRKGITPVVAMVLLLMMTVAAAGAAYVWTQGLITGQQEEAQQQLNTEITVRDLQCQSGGSSPEIDFFLDNTGSTTISSSASGSVTVYMYSVASGDLVTTQDTSSSSDISPGGSWDSTLDFSGDDMTNGQEYRIEFEFTNQGGYTISGTCQAE